MTASRIAWRPWAAVPLLALATVIPLRAQAPAAAPTDRVWFTIGAGLGSTSARAPRRYGGLAGGVTLSYKPGPVLIGLGAAGIWTFAPGDLLGHAAALVGTGVRGERSLIALAVGPGLTGGQYGPATDPPHTFHHKLGFVIHAQMIGSPLPNLGGGVSGFVNLNSRRSYGGVLLTFAFGQLR